MPVHPSPSPIPLSRHRPRPRRPVTVDHRQQRLSRYRNRNPNSRRNKRATRCHHQALTARSAHLRRGPSQPLLNSSGQRPLQHMPRCLPARRHQGVRSPAFRLHSRCPSSSHDGSNRRCRRAVFRQTLAANLPVSPPSRCRCPRAPRHVRNQRPCLRCPPGLHRNTSRGNLRPAPGAAHPLARNPMRVTLNRPEVPASLRRASPRVSPPHRRSAHVRWRHRRMFASLRANWSRTSRAKCGSAWPWWSRPASPAPR